MSQKFVDVALPIPVHSEFCYELPEKTSIEEISPGVRVLVPFGKKKEIGFITKITEKPAVAQPKKIIKIIDKEPVITDCLFKLAEFIKNTYNCSSGESLNCMFPVSIKSKWNQDLCGQEITIKQPKISEQKIPKAIKYYLKNGLYSTFVIDGFNYSERIDFYINLITYTINFGECILILPEILQIDEISSILKNNFGELLGIWHSKLSDTEKYLTWLNAKNGRIKIIVGTRWAVFLPFKNLKLLIIEEEGDYAYKNSQKPFYDATTVALQHLKLHNGIAVFGGDLMSLNSFYRVGKNEFKIIKQKRKKTEEKKMPKIEIIELTEQKYPITNYLKKEIEEKIAKNETSIVFLSRKGYAPVVMCSYCGNILRCPRCSLPLVYHIDEKLLKCHYCSHKENLPEECILCKNRNFRFIGSGTERIEIALKTLLPQAEIFRIDRDTLNTKFSIPEKYNLIVATQSIFSITHKLNKKISLIGVIDIDTMLYFPDFRATEKTFQTVYRLSKLLENSSSDINSKLIIQTHNKKYYIFKYLSSSDWKNFYFEELNFRKELNYPPVMNLAKITVRSKDKTKTEKESQKIFSLLKSSLKNEVTILGPDELIYPKLRGEYRKHILVKLSDENIAKLNSVLSSLRTSSDTHTSVDINPYEIL